MTDLPKAYTPHDVEGAIYERWLAADVFAPDGAGSTADPSLPPFTIIQPPPNITGSLHLGHAQRTAVEDLMIRHARMRGHRALFLPGLDHASIAAQFVLDGILAKEGESRADARSRALPRADARVRRHDPRGHALASSDGSARRPTGAACATRWTRARPRPSGSPSSASTRRTSPIAPRRSSTGARAAGPASATSRSIATPETGTLWSVRYHLIDPATGQPSPDETITIATTRPETILGDTAVAVHPDDPRYQPLVGRLVRIPFVERDVPIIADDGRRPGLRDRRRQDHAGPRPRRPRDRPAPRSARHRRSWPTTGRSPRPGRATTGWTGSRRAPRSSPTSRPRGDLVGRRAARDGHRALPAQQRHHRAAAQDAVVHPDDAARGTGARGDPQRTDPDPPRAIREDLGALADRHPRLERRRASCGGVTASPPGTARTAT